MQPMNENEEQSSFARYLAAKKTVDDRSLNQGVWQRLMQALPPGAAEKPWRALEVGAGIGTMLHRFIAAGNPLFMEYTLVDANPALLAEGRRLLAALGRENGFALEQEVSAITLRRPGREICARFVPAEAIAYVTHAPEAGRWDLLIAHAFLDLLNLAVAVPALLSGVRRGGLFYTSINFDGLTILEPVLDAALDEQIQALYHRTMDERRVAGRPSGDSRTGRRLFHLLRQQGVQILAAGASDWVVFPGPQGYPGDERYFLHFIVDIIAGALRNHPELDQARFAGWVKERHAQIERGELVFIAHQLDFLGLVRERSETSN